MKNVVTRGACLLALLACSPAWAQTVKVAQEYDKLIQSRTTIEALGTDLFGDRIDTHTGALEFVQTDVSLPGNNALEVSFGRRFVISRDKSAGSFGGWDLEIPHVHGIFSRDEGWIVNSTTPTNRCSKYTTPPEIVTDGHGIFSSSEYWHGTFLYMPGVGDQEVLRYLSGPRPASGTYPLTTKSGMAIKCLPTLAATSEGAGEGFEVVTPEGITYKFDHMASRAYSSLQKSAEAPPSSMTASQDDAGTLAPVSYILYRREFWLMPTSATDRFGNTVTYEWSATSPWRLDAIKSSDGRRLDIAYLTGETQVSDGSRIWRYFFTTGVGLSSVQLPDQSTWQFDLADMRWGSEFVHGGGCGAPGTSLSVLNGSIVHPSGARGEFLVKPIVRGISWSPTQCMDAGSQWAYDEYPAEYIVPAIISKKISGAGLPASGLSWSYAYGEPNGCYASTNPWGMPVCSASSPTTVTTTVTDPSNTVSTFTFGNRYKVNQGQLQRVDAGPVGFAAKRTTTSTYATTADGLYPATAGASIRPRGDGVMESRNLPVRQVVTVQDGVNFTWKVDAGCNGKPYCFDVFARPTSITRSNSISGNLARTEVTEYHDDLSLWVLGQVKRSTTNGTETARTEFTATAQPWKTYAFGKLQQTLGYDTASTAASGQRGTLKTVADGRNNVTTLTGWKRGIPGKVTYPATTDQPTAVSQSALVNDDGTLAQVTDENGFVTKYQYDAMGRLTLIDYPDGDTVVWSNTGQSFTPATTVRYGLPVGHWVQVIGTGGGRKVIDYDALWRPVVESTYISGDAASNSLVVKRYDAAGRLAFQSYPLASLANYADTALKGTYYTYDALDRVTKLEQDWEGAGKLTTTTEYLPGFQTRVTQPRHTLAQPQQTTTSYLAWDQPTYDYPRGINHPEGAYTSIYRNIFGNPYAIARYNADNSVRQTRWYVYDAHQQLCKTIDDETGATVMHYDGAGNLDWSGSGLNALASTTDCQHDHATVAARKVTRSYDARNRLKTLSFPNGVGNTTSTYTPDSLLASLVADNGGGQIVTTSYTYNRRRLLEMEQMQWGAINWPVDYAYNTNGHLASQTFSGLLTDFAPDALGRPTKAGPFASGVSYHPNGAIKQFTYGNGITHTLTQNVRGLPDTSCDSDGACGAASVLNDGYDYDQNGNVAAISDGRTGNRGHRTMIYDALDRLTRVGSRMFGTTGAVTNAFYFYDVLDNLTRTKILDRDHYYCYNAHRQLAFVRTGAVCTGSTPSPAVTALEYDVQGNLSDKNSQTFAFDFGNRLRGVNTPASSYVYDGHGRRVRDYTTASKYSLYSNGGQLVFDSDGRTGLQHWYVYLQGSLVAIRERNTATNVYTTQYQHTDALGSPVAVTNAARTVIEKSEYEPFGKVINHPAKDGPGYTGHVLDAATGMNYMQQRMFDPGIGRFLSVDPVTAYGTGDWRFFNRYAYAFNAPYTFKDPDGRESAMFQFGQYRMAQPSAEGIAGAAEFTPGIGDAMGIAQAIQNPTFANIAAAGVGFLPIVGDAVAKVIKSADDVGDLAKAGRAGRQERLREIANDPKASSADRGWIRNEQRQIQHGNRDTIRNPPGKDLAHERGREAAKGYSYKNSNLQDRDLHRTQHKYDDFGRANKERPLE